MDRAGRAWGLLRGNPGPTGALLCRRDLGCMRGIAGTTGRRGREPWREEITPRAESLIVVGIRGGNGADKFIRLNLSSDVVPGVDGVRALKSAGAGATSG